MGVKGLIFDLDGTLADTSRYWVAAEDEVIRWLGGERTEELARRFAGLGLRDLAAVMVEEFGGVTVEECEDRLRETVLRNLEEGEIREIPGAVRMVRRLGEMGLPMAVASGSSFQMIGVVLEKLGLDATFDSWVSSEGVRRGKPAPDVFWAAAKSLGVPVGECVVFEDSLPGLRAALSAGARPIIRPRGPLAGVLRWLAPVSVASWDEVTSEVVLVEG